MLYIGITSGLTHLFHNGSLSTRHNDFESTTVQILIHNLLDNRTKIAILPLKPILILQEKSIEVMKKHSIENSAFRMMLTIDLCHSRDKDS